MSERVAMNPDYIWTLKWWAFGGRFPLVPQLRIRAADSWNTAGFYFHWLGFRAWSMDSVDVGFEVNLSDTDLGLRFRVPYLILGFWLPVFPQSWSQKLWRKPKRDVSP